MIVKFKPLPTQKISLLVKEDEKHLWPVFAKHHYMTCDLPTDKSFPSAAKMFTFYWNNILVGCLGVQFQIASYPAKRLTRVVVLPEFQGLGISSKMVNAISDYYTSLGFKVYGATYHPRLGEFREKSPNWQAGHYNQREFKLSDAHESMNGLRDGEKMYRHFYVQDKKYNLIYDPYEISELEKELKEVEKDLSESSILRYKEIRKELKKLYKFTDKELPKEKFLDSLLSNEENQKYKQFYKRNKRKLLTNEERKVLKEQKAKNDIENNSK